MRKASNFRDLGLLPAEGRRQVRPGCLYRSGHFSGATPKLARKLRVQRNLGTVVDFRAPSELREKADSVMEGIAYRWLPLLTDEQNPSVNRHNRMRILKNLMKRSDGTRGYLRETYRAMISSELACESLRQLFDILIDSEDGVCWHCTQGKDRTGVGTAVILLALGVDRETIMRDYLRTNRACRWKNSAIFVGSALWTLSIRTAYSLHCLLTAREEYLKAAFDEIDTVFGSTDGYLRKALALDDAKLARLREKYLTPLET